MQNTAIALTLAISLLTTTAAQAQANCDALNERVNACEQVIDLANSAVDKQAETIRTLDDQNKRLQESLDYEIAQTKAAKAWYRDPKVVGPLALIAGIALGAFTVKTVTK